MDFIHISSRTVRHENPKFRFTIPRIRLLKITPNYVSLLANILASFFFNRLINAKKVKLKVIGGLKVLSIFFFLREELEK